MNEVRILRGVPASGKSTYARELAQEGWVIVNRDSIRHAMFNEWFGGNIDENLVTQIEHKMITEALTFHKNVVVDATNLRNQNVKALAKVVWEIAPDTEVSIYDFPVTLNLAITRDKFRQAMGERYVGDNVIRSFFTKNKINPDSHILPQAPELVKPVVPVFAPYKREDKLAGRAIIVDIDGTLAHMTNRGPYDASKYADDSYDWTVAKVALNYASAQYGGMIIVMSGRDEAYREVTEAWLEKFGFTFDHLFMRPKGDLRKDWIVKNELFDKHILHRFNIDFILDDRNQVVNAWRARGLKVLQVAEGDF